MQRYEKYKDSGLSACRPAQAGIEWLGRIPAHWEVKKLKDVVKINSDTLSEKTNEKYKIFRT